jgi:phosphatidate cytidylyltransferase
MLAQRIITAIVLLAILVFALSVQSKWPLLTFLSLMVAVATYEWIKLTLPNRPSLAWATSMAILALTLFQSWNWQVELPAVGSIWHLCVTLTAFVWIFVIPIFIFMAKSTNPLKSWTLFAPVCLFATWGVLGLTWIQSGAWALISLLTIVWIADVFAYFGGRQFGRHKLAPAISPGKTREGALIGIVGVVLWMLVSSQWAGSYAADVLNHWGFLGLVLAGGLLGSIAVLGDLFESLLKRCAGVKDSGRLLPGHGGVYDRVDAVVAVVPVAFLLVSDFWY